MSKESFKIFAGNHPELADHVLNGEVSWQKLYELFDIYGENSSVWSKFINTTSNSEIGFKDILNNLKNIDVDSFQKGIDNLQKTIGLIQDLPFGGNVDKPYIPREVYHHMED